MKVGEPIIVEFHTYGLKLEKAYPIIGISDNEIEVDENGVSRKFNSRTGECLNDTSFQGGKRRLKLPKQ